ncbi:unnamed protein product, partial [Acanthoscelides obtectus]
AGASSYSNQVKKVNINTTAKQREASSASSEATVVTSRQTVSNTEIRSEVCNDEVATAPELEDIASEQQKEEFEGRFEFQRKQTRKQKYNHQKQRKSLKYGECNDEEFNLAGDNKDKKNWLFLSKVNETITENTISDYIVKHASTTANEIQGVPQGSILGPLLFLLYVNGLRDRFMEGLICQYADDTTVVLTASDMSGLSGVCSCAVGTMQDWCKDYALRLNADKTGLLTFSKSSARDESLLVRCNSGPIPEMTDIKFLGIYLDSSLNWDCQTFVLVGKLHSFCALVRRLRNEVSLTTLRQFYYSSVQSLLTYSIMFWGSSRGAMSVFIAQKRILRCILRLHPRTSCREHFSRLGFLTVPSLYFLALVLFVKKHMYLFNSNAHYYAKSMTVVTRGRENLSVPAHSSAFFKRAPLYMAVKTFNMLPIDIKSESKPIRFKRAVEKFLLDRCLYTFDFNI